MQETTMEETEAVSRSRIFTRILDMKIKRDYFIIGDTISQNKLNPYALLVLAGEADGRVREVKSSYHT